MLGKVSLVATCLLSVTSAFFFGPDWNGLYVKWGVNPLDSSVLEWMPRTVEDAVEHEWTQISACDNNGRFRGNRYVKDNDYAVVLLFDVQGYIAGIQCGITGSDAYPPMKQRGNIFQEDGGRFFVTAYFVDPATICASGRSSEDYDDQGTGTDLYIQNGSDPVAQSLQIPKSEQDVTRTSWTKGKCFKIRMGVHYWYDVSERMSCADFQPVFLLYNAGKLNAFGWAMGINGSSSHFEHPDHDKISWFMNPVPQCLQNYPTLSTMHIYLTAYPSLNLC